MVTTLIFLQQHPAAAALLEQIFFRQINSHIPVAISTVPWQQALAAERNVADRASKVSVFDVDESIAIIGGTYF